MKRALVQSYAIKLIAMLIALFGSASAVEAQRVVLVNGDVNGPAKLKTLREKATLRNGDVVDVPEGSLGVLEYSWRSNVEGYPCVRMDYIKGQRTSTVKNVKEEGSCHTERNPPDCKSPGCMGNGSIYFYGEPKADAPRPPEWVLQSVEAGKKFDDELRKKRIKRNSAAGTRVP